MVVPALFRFKNTKAPIVSRGLNQKVWYQTLILNNFRITLSTALSSKFEVIVVLPFVFGIAT
jgi:hypothetical protein